MSRIEKIGLIETSAEATAALRSYLVDRLNDSPLENMLNDTWIDEAKLDREIDIVLYFHFGIQVEAS